MISSRAFPLCNGRPGTGPVVCGVHAPLCWRCLGAALAIGALGIVESLGWELRPGLGVGAALIALGALDGFRSYLKKAGTTNANRMIFGVLLGAGVWISLMGHQAA